MKTKSVSESAFVNPRPLIGRFSCSIGVLLALLVFVALPSSSARASQGQCGDVSISWEYGGPNDIYYELSVSPSTCTIYVTTTLNNPTIVDPTWNFMTGVPISPTFTVANGAEIHIPLNSTMYIKARAWQSRWTQSVNISKDDQHNPNN